ncbi:unnamed protein product [Caenorhabditis brenneri]
MSIVQQLIAMGFPSESAELAAGNNRNLDQALNYIENDGIGFESIGTPSPSESTLPTEADINVPTVAQSFRCNDCGKLLPTDDAMIKHGQVTKHLNFSATTEKALTVEQKQEQLAEIVRKIKENNEKKAVAEVEEARELELNRRNAGQAMAGYREEAREREIREAAKQLRQKKIDDEAAKKQVLEQIRLDRLDREERMAKKTVAPSAILKVVVPPKDGTITNIQFRLWNGKVVKKGFRVEEPLITLRVWIEANHAMGTPFTMMTPFPRKVFSEEDMEMSLKELNLIPSANIMVALTQPSPAQTEQ